MDKDNSGALDRYSLTHSLTHLLTYSLTYSLTRLLTHSGMNLKLSYKDATRWTPAVVTLCSINSIKMAQNQLRKKNLRRLSMKLMLWLKILMTPT